MTQHYQTNDQTPQEGQAVIYRRQTYSQLPTTQPNDLETLAREQGYSSVIQRSALDDVIKTITLPEEGQEPIRAIFAASEDRLFRDGSGIDVTAFIEICRQHGVLLITPMGEYDFSNPVHVQLFHFKVQAAYQYVTQMVTNRLQAGKREATLKRREAGN